MDKYAPKFSKVLLTPDPHYIPGYTGYCPQLKFSFAKPYGKLTGELLTSPEVNHSGRLVLSTGHDPSVDTDPTLRGFPDSNLNRAIPGYTGFIPKSRNYFASTYSETCRRALTESFQESQARLHQRSSSLPAIFSHDLQPTDRPKIPLTPISDEVFTYKPSKSFVPAGNPYSMEDENPHKHFISGFTGHVPQARFLLGKGYPMTTNQALIQFGRQQLASKDNSGRKIITTRSVTSVYQSVVPSYTGHLPGYRFMYGRSFGQLSKDALEKIHSDRSLREKS